MQRYEYKVVPAPRKGEKARGLKSTEDRFAHALSRVMNEMARDGWEYQRTDTLPVEERAGLTGTRTVFQNMLVFRKDLTPAAPVQMQSAVALQPMAQPTPAPSVLPPAPPVAPATATAASPAIEADPLDIAAKRAALTAQTGEGAAPKLTIEAQQSAAPTLGPAKTAAQ